jgi:hypothetical protein
LSASQSLISDWRVTPQSTRFAVEGIHHPSREVHVNPPRICADASSFAYIELIDNLPPGVKFAIKRLRFHKLPPLRPVTASRK